MSDRPHTPLLDLVGTPEDLRKLDRTQLRQLGYGLAFQHLINRAGA